MHSGYCLPRASLQASHIVTSSSGRPRFTVSTLPGCYSASMTICRVISVFSSFHTPPKIFLPHCTTRYDRQKRRSIRIEPCAASRTANCKYQDQRSVKPVARFEGEQMPGLRHDPTNETDIRLQQDLKTSPIFFFGVVVVSTWEAYSNTAVISLSNGGPRSSIVGVFVAGVGAWCIVRSLSNMAKQEPYIGAQYRWTKMYCPPGLQPLFWSHIQGWLVTWAWIVSAAVLPYYTASQILGVATLFYPDYISEG